jgi:hypothetical protein
MTTDRVIHSWALPRHLGGPRMEFDNDPPPPQPAPPPPAPPQPEIPRAPDTPPRGVNQTTEDRLAQLESINADLRVEAAQRRVSERTANERLTANDTEMARLRSETTSREAQAEQRGAALSTKLRNKTIDAELRAAAATAGMTDFDLLPLVSKQGVTCDDEGNVVGVQAAIDEFKTRKPEFFRTTLAAPPSPPRRTGDPTPPPPTNNAPPPPTDLRNASKADYERSKREATAALRGR